MKATLLATLIILGGSGFMTRTLAQTHRPALPVWPRYLPATQTPNFTARPTAPAEYSVARTLVVFIESGIGGWTPYLEIHRRFDATGRMAEEFGVTYGHPADTTFKSLFSYDAAGNQTLARYFDFSGTSSQESTRYISTYDAHGAATSFVDMHNYPAPNRLDTLAYNTYRFEYDARGRVQVAHTHEVTYQYAFVPNPGHPDDTVRTLLASDQLDSVYYQSPISRIHGGHASFSQTGSTITPVSRERFSLMDSTHYYPRRWQQFSWQNGAYHLTLDADGWTLPNGHYRRVQRSFEASSNEFKGEARVEIGLDPRLPGNTPSRYRDAEDTYYQRFVEMSGEVYNRYMVFDSTMAFQYSSVTEDSLGFDARNRLTARAVFQSFATTDSSLSQATDRYRKFIVTELGPTGIQPSTAPQTLAIAPGPSTQTALLVNLPAGQWLASLVDMQGRSTLLPSPAKTGIVQIPTLATGIYSLHLKDKAGRHLHGRFAWEK